MDTRSFYDDLADEYHLLYADWPGSIRRQAAVLDGVIRGALGEGPQRILDCTCGIGTQALGLAELGHEVMGTDLSPRAVERAQREARERGLSVDFRVVDLRSLANAVPGEFDVVLSGDNALPHLPTEADLRMGCRAMLAKVRPGGLLLASVRDYDSLLEERPAATPVGTAGPEGERRVVFQLWDWGADGRSYRLELFLLREEGERWTARSHTGSYRAITRDELSAILREEAGVAARWIMPEESGFFQPLLVAVRAG